VLVHDQSTLVGVAPGFCDRGPARIVRWRPLAAQTCQHVEPFAIPGREREVAVAVAAALYDSRPRPQVLSFEGVREQSAWPALLAEAWPGGRPRIHQVGTTTALVLDLGDDGYDAWLAGKSAHFRQRLRRSRKLAEESGGVFRLADSDTAEADLESFLRLHLGRWEQRGGTHAVPPAVAAFLRATGPQMVRSGRLRIWSLDLDGKTVASSLVLRAGSEVGYWLSGFDTAHARLEPSKSAMLRIVEDALGLGARRLDLGEGSFDYKRRFSDAEETLVHRLVVPRSTRAPQVALGLAPARVRIWAAQRLSIQRKARLRAWFERRPHPSS